MVAIPDEDGMAAANDGDVDDGQSTMAARSAPDRRFKEDRAILARFLAPRIRAARELNGVKQTDLARELGYANPTQINLFEQARRAPNLTTVARAATALGVSVDWLLGLTSEADHDPALARRAALQRSVRGQLDQVVTALADTFEKHSALETPVATAQLVRAAEQLVSAVNGFIGANETAFLDMKRGAPLALASRQLGEVVAATRDRMERHDRFEAELRTTLEQARFGS